ncbi:hypothetical protein P2H44_21095 [Albimonas sp. CAU 1670]|uniref:hypothetical protein n=1 Tax=Albimonas sp. CAU 1670 TaxID=3032599 RepID=UPI0023DA8A3B|nr:hypothetical protein [Albimonas sp. CAU 1670]MDF2235065.1 hypothetical protein [Albimonas sp. CAU 1670]
MAEMIYRGFPHDGIAQTPPRAPLALVYRGVTHDGLGSLAAPASRNMPMRYRGVAYRLSPSGRSAASRGGGARPPIVDLPRMRPAQQVAWGR